MANSNLDASIIIPLWNGKQDIEACLDSVYQQSAPTFEIIVVDNASRDSSPDLVAERFPQARLIRNVTNLGFAGGVNVGLRAAHGDVMVLLNQDTEVQAGWLQALVDAAQLPSAGVIGSKALYPDGTIQHAGGQVNLRGAGSHIGQHEADDGRWNSSSDCAYVSGASIAITRTAYNAVGGLDEDFAPAYYEDVDYCYGVREAGYTVRYEPKSVLIHKEKSVGFGTDIRRQLIYQRNRLRFVLKHWAVNDFVIEFLPAEIDWIANLWNLDLYASHIYLYRAYLATLYASRNLLSDRYAPYSPEWAEYVNGLNTLAAQASKLLSGFPAYNRSQSSSNRKIFAGVPITHAYRPDIAFVPSERKNPRKILVVTPNFPPKGYLGGAEISCYHTTKGLLSRGVQIHVLSVNARQGKSDDEHYSYDGIPVHRMTFPTKHRTAMKDVVDYRVYRAVRKELQCLKPDIVHVHNVSASSLAPFVATGREQIPTVCTLHDFWLLCPNNMLHRLDGSFCEWPEDCTHCYRRYEFWGDVPKRRQVFKHLTRNVNAFMTPSLALMNRHIEAGYDPRRFAPVRLGFTESSAVPVVHPGVKRLVAAQQNGVPTVLFTGGGVESKGAAVMIQALQPLITSIPNVRIIIAGGGEAHDLNKMRALSPLVTVLGRIPFTDMRHLMSLADLVLLPSIWHENSPVTIFEAYQVGTPVVGSDYGGLPENVDEWETGYTFPVRRYDIMAKRIIGHFSRPAVERRKMRMNCLRKVRTELNLEQHLDATLQVYSRVLGL